MRRICVVMVLPDFSFHSQTFCDEVLAAEVVAADALLLQLALHHDLRGDAGMVGAGHPQRVEAAHPVVARQAVHDGLVERVPHVQRAGDVRRRQLDGEGRLALAGLAGAAVAGARVAALFPQRAPLAPRWRRVRRTWKAVQPRLFGAHPGILRAAEAAGSAAELSRATAITPALSRRLHAFLQHLGVADLVGQQQDQAGVEQLRLLARPGPAWASSSCS